METLAVEQAVGLIPDGASLMIGGFMAVGTPERVVDEIVRQSKRDLTVIANDTAMPGKGIGKLARIIHERHQLVRISAEILGFCRAAGANSVGVG
jgi:acyl CoA:acetate/3-ketoacid CoA transferase alpha subunit